MRNKAPQQHHRTRHEVAATRENIQRGDIRERPEEQTATVQAHATSTKVNVNIESELTE